MDNQGEYYVYDFMTASTRTIKAPPPDCDKTPLINSLKVLCFSDGKTSIYDLQSEVRTALLIDEASYVWQQPSIPELLFYIKNDTIQNENSYYSFNLRNNESKFLITLKDDGFESLPTFSPSVDNAVAVINNEVIRIDLQSSKYTTIFSSDEHTTFNIMWSPTLPVVAFGATDNPQQEIGERANQIYLLNVESGNIEQLFPNGEMESYFSETDQWPIWSPSGDTFIAIAYEKLLIIRINGEVQTIQGKTNTQGAEGYPIGGIAWSPDGAYIAFLEYPNGFLENTNLVIYSMDENRLINVIENEEMSVIFWR
jgi:Tol biopolymer transport system component